jgi:ferritin
VNDRGGQVVLKGVPQPATKFKGLLDVFQGVLEHEKKVTGMIHRLYGAAVKENEYPTQILLQWFITEQVEEEKNATEVIEQLKLIGEHGAAIIMLDRHLGERK